MKTNTNTYKVLINGDEYQLVSDEAEAHVLKSAEKVNEIIEQLSAGSNANKKMVAIVAALQLASEVLRLQEDKEKRQQHEKDLTALIDRSIASL